MLSLTRPHAGALRAEDAAREVCDRRLLWRFGISGDRPLILVSAGAMQGLGLLRSLAQALRLWSWGGVACDLVVVNAEPASYQMALQRELAALRERHAAESCSPAGRRRAPRLHVLRADELSADELSTLQQPGARAPAAPTAARCCTMCRTGPRCTRRRWLRRQETSTTALADAVARRPRRAGAARRASPPPRASSASS